MRRSFWCAASSSRKRYFRWGRSALAMARFVRVHGLDGRTRDVLVPFGEPPEAAVGCIIAQDSGSLRHSPSLPVHYPLRRWYASSGAIRPSDVPFLGPRQASPVQCGRQPTRAERIKALPASVQQHVLEIEDCYAKLRKLAASSHISDSTVHETMVNTLAATVAREKRVRVSNLEAAVHRKFGIDMTGQLTELEDAITKSQDIYEAARKQLKQLKGYGDLKAIKERLDERCQDSVRSRDSFSAPVPCSPLGRRGGHRRTSHSYHEPLANHVLAGQLR